MCHTSAGRQGLYGSTTGRPAGCGRKKAASGALSRRGEGHDTRQSSGGITFSAMDRNSGSKKTPLSDAITILSEEEGKEGSTIRLAAIRNGGIRLHPPFAHGLLPSSGRSWDQLGLGIGPCMQESKIPACRDKRRTCSPEPIIEGLCWSRCRFSLRLVAWERQARSGVC